MLLGKETLRRKKHIGWESLFLNIPSFVLCIWNLTSWWLLLVDLVPTSAELEVPGTLGEKSLETAVWVLTGFLMVGLKEFAGFSGEFLESSGSFSSLGMPFPSEDKSSSTREKDKGNYLQTYSLNTIKRSKHLLIFNSSHKPCYTEPQTSNIKYTATPFLAFIVMDTVLKSKLIPICHLYFSWHCPFPVLLPRLWTPHESIHF